MIPASLPLPSRRRPSSIQSLGAALAAAFTLSLSVAMPVCLGLASAIILPCSVFAGDNSKQVREFTGAPTRAVWIQDAGDTACVMGERPTVKLIGLDTEDGKGERAILPELRRYNKPLISADGQRVFFGEGDQNIVYVVNWDGTGLRALVKDAHFEEVWTDPRDGVEWIYAKVTEKRGAEDTPVIRRYRVDKPEVSELVWDKMNFNNFMISGDGRQASGGGGGGNSPQGVITLPNGTFHQRAGGCWPSMSPDTSHRMWVFTGNHRSIHFFTPTNKSGTAYNEGVVFDKTPGIKLQGREEMYHPRWSNNVRYMALTSPLSEWSYKADAKIPNNVAEKVEIYIGKFADDMKTMERFVQVSSNNRGDYFPDIWIKPSPEQQAELAKGTAAPQPAEEDNKAPDNKGLVYTWETGAQGNQLDDPKTGAIRQCGGQFRGEGRFGQYHVMDVTFGSWLTDGADTPLLEGVKAGKAFAVEAILTPKGSVTAQPKTIIAFADQTADGAPGNFILEQRGEWLTLRAATEKTPGKLSQPVPLVRLTQNAPNHIFVSLGDDGKLSCSINGGRVIFPGAAQVLGKPAGWTPQHLVFGDSYSGGANWPGLIEGIGIYTRAVTDGEARQRYGMALEKRGGSLTAAPDSTRKPIETILVEAKLVGTCPAADPKGIAPYKRNLSIQKYEIQKVLKGKLTEKEITVAQWSVLDGQVVPTYGKLPSGQTCRLALEPWEARPEQESERSLAGNFEGSDTLTLFYEVRNPELPFVAVLNPAASAPASTASAAPSTSGDFKPVDGPQKLTAPLNIAADDMAFSLPTKADLNMNGQPVTFVTNSFKELMFNGVVRMGGNRSVTAATVVAGGDGYLQAPKVVFTAAPGSSGGKGATGEAIMAVQDLEVVRLGSGYTSEPKAIVAEPDIAGGRRAKARVFIDKVAGTISKVDLVDGGTGYTRPPRIILKGGGGKDAELEAKLGVSGIIITDGGSGYTVPPLITLEGGDGQHAQVLSALQMTTLRFTADGGNARLINAGTLDQYGASIIWDYAAEKRNNGNRCFINNGTWTMQHGSVLKWMSSTGIDNNSSGNINTGTLRILDRSSVGISRLENSGTIEFGTGVVIGQAENAGGDALLINKSGEIRVTGDEPVLFGLIDETRCGKRRIENGIIPETAKPEQPQPIPAGLSPARFIIGTGKDKANLTSTGAEVVFANAAGSRLEIMSGASLYLITNDNGSNHPFNSRTARVTNKGDFVLAGTLRVQGNHGGYTGIENGGILIVKGDNATLERMRNSSGPGGTYHEEDTCARISNGTDGVIQGTGKLTYINSTSRDAGRFLRITNSGTINPGETTGGAQGSPETFGQLKLHNVILRFGNLPPREKGAKEKKKAKGDDTYELLAGVENTAGTLRIDIGGPATDAQRYDSVALTGDVKPDEGKTGIFELLEGAGAKLNIVPQKGVTPRGTYRIVSASSGVYGRFQTLQYNGSADAVPYTINYLPNAVEVVFP